IKTILIKHPARENAKIDEQVSAAIDYFESVRTSLSMVDSRKVCILKNLRLSRCIGITGKRRRNIPFYRN
ncbi:MAG: hypothetical protein LBC48_00465, partial [Dysgonamonadaceae bacterium]|nr:hypothetical protein [Dysgonamonadaceae bacterium]